MEKKKIEPLLAERKKRAKETNKRLHEALDRFEIGSLLRIPVNSKLSIRNLAIEATVNKDTPFSRYKESSNLVGKYRFPSVVKRFKEIKARIELKNKKFKPQNRIAKLQNTIRDYEDKFVKQARITNLQNQRIVELEKYCRDLENQLSILRSEKPKVLKFPE